MIPSDDEEEESMTKILVATGKNSVQIHARCRLMARTSTEDFCLPLKESSEHYLGNLTDQGRELVEEIAKIDGVTRIQVGLNYVTLYVSPVYEWEEELSKPVLDLFEKICYTDSDVKIETVTTDELYART